MPMLRIPKDDAFFTADELEIMVGHSLRGDPAEEGDRASNHVVVSCNKEGHKLGLAYSNPESLDRLIAKLRRAQGIAWPWHKPQDVELEDDDG